MLDDDDLIVGTKTVVRPFWKRLVTALVTLTLAGFVGGYVWFAQSIATTTAALDDIGPADGIMAPTGGQSRLSTAFDLLLAGKAKRLLVTGADTDLTPAILIDYLNIQPNENIKKTTFHCCVDIEKEAQDTIGNAAAMAKWVAANNYTDVIIVTSAYHMPRTMLLAQHNMPTTTLHPYPVISPSVPTQDWYKKPRTALLIGEEYAKTIAVWVSVQWQGLIGR